jgi:hypothetical protein
LAEGAPRGDLLFGKEEEFDYTSTTAPPATPQPTAGAST